MTEPQDERFAALLGPDAQLPGAAQVHLRVDADLDVDEVLKALAVPDGATRALARHLVERRAEIAQRLAADPELAARLVDAPEKALLELDVPEKLATIPDREAREQLLSRFSGVVVDFGTIDLRPVAELTAAQHAAIELLGHVARHVAATPADAGPLHDDPRALVARLAADPGVPGQPASVAARASVADTVATALERAVGLTPPLTLSVTPGAVLRVPRLRGAGS